MLCQNKLSHTTPVDYKRACAPQMHSHGQHSTGLSRADGSPECTVHTWSNDAKNAHVCAHGRPEGWLIGRASWGHKRAARHNKTFESGASRGFKASYHLGSILVFVRPIICCADAHKATKHKSHLHSSPACTLTGAGLTQAHNTSEVTLDG